MTEQELNRLLEKSGKAIQAANNVKAFLEDQLSLGLPLHEEAAVNAQLQRANGDLEHLRLVEAHLRAAVVIIAPLSPTKLAKLDALADKLDTAIRNDFVISATLALAKRALQSAEEIGDILS